MHLIKNETFLFLTEYRAELEQQMLSFPEDIEQLSDTISAWCKNRPELRQALSKTRKNLFGKTSGNDKSPSGSVPAAKPKNYTTLLKNQIRESFAAPSPNQPDNRK
jgi:hypothetical protein